MRRLRKGDSRAMKETYDRYVGGLTSLCSRYVADAEDVKDILQECFVKIFGSIDSFEYLGEGSLNAWMSRIVVNRAISFVRNYESFESLDILSDIPAADPNASPFRTAPGWDKKAEKKAETVPETVDTAAARAESVAEAVELPIAAAVAEDIADELPTVEIAAASM